MKIGKSVQMSLEESLAYGWYSGNGNYKLGVFPIKSPSILGLDQSIKLIHLVAFFSIKDINFAFCPRINWESDWSAWTLLAYVLCSSMISSETTFRVTSLTHPALP